MIKTWEINFLQKQAPIEAEFKKTAISDYVLPVASPERLGGVRPISKTEDMVQPVGVDASGALWVRESQNFSKSTDEEIIAMLVQEDMFMAVKDSDGSYLSDESGNILLW